MPEETLTLPQKDIFVNVFNLQLIPPQYDKHWMVGYTPKNVMEEEALSYAFGKLETVLRKESGKKIESGEKLNSTDSPHIFNQSGSDKPLGPQQWEFWMDKGEEGKRRLEEDYLPRITSIAQEYIDDMNSLG